MLLLFNLELDTLRADLGLFGFPSKDMQWSYLSTFTPAFYIRQRDYSKTVNVAPYLINYSGALFRDYPGPWQVMLRQDSGEYACIAEDADRCDANLKTCMPGCMYAVKTLEELGN